MTDLINLKKDAEQVLEAPHQPAFTGVRIFVGQDDDGDDLYFSAGNDTGSVLEIENPWGTQAIANNILSAISGYAYQPMQADEALLDPAAEMGDGISVNGVYSVLAKNDTRFGNLLVSDIAAPSDGELGHEYPYVSRNQRNTQRQISQASSSLYVQIDEIKGQVTDDQGNYTVMTLKSDGLYVGGTSTKMSGSNISNGTITSTQLGTGAVTETKIAAGAITTGKIATGAVTADQIYSHTITSDEIDTRTIKAENIKTGAITANEIAANTITAAEIDSHTITADELRLRGMINFYASTGTTTYAQLGYGSGLDGSSSTPTYGAKMVSTGGSNEIIVTNGGARMTAGTGHIYTVNGACWSSHQFQYDSDARIKTDVDDDLTDYKAVLMSLRPVSYKYIPERGTGDNRYTGLIAQEVEAVRDEYGLDKWTLASVSGEGIHGVCYEQLVPVLVSCVQDLMREVQELKEQLNG